MFGVASSLVERLTALAFVASLSIGCRVLAVDGFGEDARTSGLSYTSRTAEKIGMSELLALHSVLQSSCQCLLTYHRVEGDGAVFSCRNDIFVHNSKNVSFCKGSKNLRYEGWTWIDLIVNLIKFLIFSPILSNLLITFATDRKA